MKDGKQCCNLLLLVYLATLNGFGTISTVARAANDVINQPMQGWYAGLEAGRDNLEITGYHEDVSPFPYRRDHIDLEYKENTLGGFVGRGWYSGTRYWGIELNAMKFNDEIVDVFPAKPDGDFKLFNITNDWKLQLSGLLGKRFSNDVLIYGRAGLSYTDIEVGTVTVTEFDSSGTPTKGYGGSVHDWIGGVAGIGVAVPLSPQWSLRGEFNYTTYFIGPEYDNDKKDGEKTDYHLDDNRISFGIAYTF